MDKTSLTAGEKIVSLADLFRSSPSFASKLKATQNLREVAALESKMRSTQDVGAPVTRASLDPTIGQPTLPTARRPVPVADRVKGAPQPALPSQPAPQQPPTPQSSLTAGQQLDQYIADVARLKQQVAGIEVKGPGSPVINIEQHVTTINTRLQVLEEFVLPSAENGPPPKLWQDLTDALSEKAQQEELEALREQVSAQQATNTARLKRIEEVLNTLLLALHESKDDQPVQKEGHPDLMPGAAKANAHSDYEKSKSRKR